MVFSVVALLVIVAFLTAIANAMGKCPAWVPLILLCIIELLRIAPLR